MTSQHLEMPSIARMVTTTENEYISSRYEGHTRWLVELNDGTLCYQDDGRPDLASTAPSGWIRLRNYCLAEGKYIISMYLQFRKETIALPKNQDGYYFCNAALSWLNDNRTFHYYVAGYVDGDIIRTKRYKIPELVVEEEDVRQIDKEDLCLILRKDKR